MDYKTFNKGCLEEAKRLYKTANADQRYVLEKLFPELRESEDEKIRKEIVRFIQMEVEDEIVGNKWLAWLEKQGEQKSTLDYNADDWYVSKVDGKIHNMTYNPTDKAEPKFKVGDWVVVSTAEGDRVVQIASVEYFKDGHPSYFTTEGRWFGNGTKARLLTDKDMETITLPESKVIVNQKPAWSKEDENRVNRLIAYFEDKESFTAEDDIVYANWLKSLKDRVQPKQEWRAEDKVMLDEIIDFFENGTVKLQHDLSLYASWLKSLRPQNRWKPSDDEIEKASQEWDSKAIFNPFYMTMDGDKPTGVKQDITTHKESFKAGVEWILKKIGF